MCISASLTIAGESDNHIWKTFSTINTNTKLENECDTISTSNPSKLNERLDAIISAVKAELSNKGLIKKER